MTRTTPRADVVGGLTTFSVVDRRRHGARLRRASVLKLAAGAREVSPIGYVLAALFVLRYALL